MKKLPVLSGKKVIKALSKVGFQVVRQKGSHVILIKFVEGKKSGLTREEFLKLLK
ncbi:MAG: type II toxin-antitoxin system HicA family toxin [Candidatus Aenigmarchaeota archaeon]|nr:type II toxin-antitoxin system HicA family toxin [Candidatus Aenigmarchaeota archaeon]